MGRARRTRRSSRPDDAGSSRLGIDFVQAPSATGTAGAAAPNRVSSSSQTAAAGGRPVPLGFGFEGSGASDLDYLDMNGDQFPDVVGTGASSSLAGFGDLEAANRPVGRVRAAARSTISVAVNLGVGGSPAQFAIDGRGQRGLARAAARRAEGERHGDPDGHARAGGERKPGVGDVERGVRPRRPQRRRASRSGDSRRTRSFAWRSISGYSFAARGAMGDRRLNAGKSDERRRSGPISASTAASTTSPAGSRWTRTVSRFPAILVDVNGDGLPDRLHRDGDTLYVGINVGNGFLPDMAWGGTPSAELRDERGRFAGGGRVLHGGDRARVRARVLRDPQPGGGRRERPSPGRRRASSTWTGTAIVDHVASSRTTRRGRPEHDRPHQPLPLASSALWGPHRHGLRARGKHTDQPRSRWVLSRMSRSTTVFPGDGVDTVATFRYEAAPRTAGARVLRLRQRSSRSIATVGGESAIYRIDRARRSRTTTSTRRACSCASTRGRRGPAVHGDREHLRAPGRARRGRWPT